MLTDVQSSSNIHLAKQKAGQELKGASAVPPRLGLGTCLKGAQRHPRAVMVVGMGTRQTGFRAAAQMFTLTFLLIYLFV